MSRENFRGAITSTTFRQVYFNGLHLCDPAFKTHSLIESSCALSMIIGKREEHPADLLPELQAKNIIFREAKISSVHCEPERHLRV